MTKKKETAQDHPTFMGSMTVAERRKHTELVLIQFRADLALNALMKFGLMEDMTTEVERQKLYVQRAEAQSEFLTAQQRLGNFRMKIWEKIPGAKIER